MGRPLKRRNDAKIRYWRVIDYYFANGFKQSEAMLAVGYSDFVSKHRQHIVFGREDVKQEIAKRMAKLREKSEVDRDWIIEKYKQLVETSLGELIEVDENDGRYGWVDLKKLTPAQRVWITEFTVEEYKEGRGENAEAVIKTKIKMISDSTKKGALDSLSRILGLFNDKVTLEGEVSLVERLQRGRERANLPKENGE